MPHRKFGRASDEQVRFFVFPRPNALRDDNFEELRHFSVPDLAKAKLNRFECSRL